MSGVAVEIGSRQLAGLLEELRRRVADPVPALEEIGAGLEELVRLGFHDSRDPWGGEWAGLRPVTLARRRKGRGAGAARPLRDSGNLMNSITSRAQRDRVVVGTAVEYAPTHQYGARRGQYGRTRRGAPVPWGDVPARPFLPLREGHVELPDAWVREIAEVIRAHLEAGE